MRMTRTSSTLGDERHLALLAARRELWSLVAIGFIDPFHRERLALMDDGAFRERCSGAAALLVSEYSKMELGAGELAPSELDPGGLFDAWDELGDGRERAYRHLFGLTAFSRRCPACEIEYEPSPDVAYRAQRLADVAAFYRAFAMQNSPRCAERLDHVTVEAEFLHVLAVKEATAACEQNAEGEAICRKARRSFFFDHVGWWLPAFATRVSQLARWGCYGKLARLTAGISAAERVGLDIEPFAHLAEAAPSAVEAQGTCFECLGRAPAEPPLA